VEKATAWSEEDLIRFVDALRRISKPMLIVANKVDLPTAGPNLERLRRLDYTVIPCCAEAELALRRAAEHQLVQYKPGDNSFAVTKPDSLSENQIKALDAIRDKVLSIHGSTGVQEALNQAYFTLLKMVAVYAVEDPEHLSDHSGRVLPDVYLIPLGTTARQFAYLIHSELGESFIHAINARDKKRIGEDAILQNQDVISVVSAKGVVDLPLCTVPSFALLICAYSPE
jgi:hypothetical protein